MPASGLFRVSAIPPGDLRPEKAAALGLGLLTGEGQAAKANIKVGTLRRIILPTTMDHRRQSPKSRPWVSEGPQTLPQKDRTLSPGPHVTGKSQLLSSGSADKCRNQSCGWGYSSAAQMPPGKRKVVSLIPGTENKGKRNPSCNPESASLPLRGQRALQALPHL